MAQVVARRGVEHPPRTVRPASSRRVATWLVLLGLALVCLAETLPRLSERSPDTRYTLPQYSLGYFWDSPLGWSGLLDGALVNRDSSQFDSLAGWLRGDPNPLIPLNANVYTRFAGYAALGGAPGGLLGDYPGFVLVNLALWLAASLATYGLGLKRTGSTLIAGLAGLLVATAPLFSAFVGQGLPYVAAYALFAIGVWYCERIGLFTRAVSILTSAASGFAVGTTLLVYDLYMLPLFVLLYGWRRMARSRLALFLVASSVPKVLWAVYWWAARLPRYTQNEDHPMEALTAWIGLAQRTEPLQWLPTYGALIAHVGLNIFSAFLFLPALLALWELLHWRTLRDRGWYLAVLVAGFAPAAFMISTWPHIPRWYAYGYPAVYILAALGAVRIGRNWHVASRARPYAVAAAILAICVLVANLDLLGVTRPMELMLFQPQNWSYLWR
ncbi:MAG: hypothetical protein JO023_20340 [Chloroflexi bacterium]|nr:hypothetical protein [Chloroflexota bacterium]